MMLHFWLWVLCHLMSPFLQCRQQAVQYEKLPRALHQLLINLHGQRQDTQFVEMGTQKRRKTQFTSSQLCCFNVTATTEKHDQISNITSFCFVTNQQLPEAVKLFHRKLLVSQDCQFDLLILIQQFHHPQCSLKLTVLSSNGLRVK